MFTPVTKRQSPLSRPSADPLGHAGVRSTYGKYEELDVMRVFIASVVVGTLALAGASPAADQSNPASDQNVSVGTASSRDPVVERSSYTQTARDEMKLWQQKLRDFDAKMQVKTTEAKARASKDLDDAWTETNSAFSQLETAGEADWSGAKASFKTASAKLAVAWQKVNPAGLR